MPPFVFESGFEAETMGVDTMKDEGAALIAELFNGISEDNKKLLPLKLIGRMGSFMVRNGYRLVDGKWHQKQETTPPSRADEDQKLLRARVANLEIAIHGLWTLLQRATPIEEREAIDKMMNDHFIIMIEQGASGKTIFERV